MENKKQSALTHVIFGLYILLLTGIILFKLPFYSPTLSDGIRVINLIPFRGSFNENGALLLREIIQNTLLFIPFGVYLCLVKSHWPFRKKVLPVVGLSAAFEVIQFIFALGRSDITDLIDNTLGGIIGIGLYAVLRMIFKHRTDKIVTISALILTICAVAFFSYLFWLTHFAMSHPLQ